MTLAELQDLMWFVARLLLSLRYRVRVEGHQALRRLPKQSAILVLPNHPAYVDPPIVMSALWATTGLRPRPLVYEANYRLPFLYPFMLALEAVPVPDLEQASESAREGARQAVEAIVAGLRAGRTHILYPAGRLTRGGTERVGGTRSVADILAAVPETHLVLVRTRGLWGSSFGYAPTGSQPSLGRALIRNLGWLLANALVFTPRRPVTITIEVVPPHKRPEPRRETINPWLDAWYNADLADNSGPDKPGAEPPVFVPYHFALGPRTYEFPKPEGSDLTDIERVKPATKQVIAGLIADKIGRPLTEAENQAQTPLDTLGIDSLDRMELTLAVENRFGFSGGTSPVLLGQFWMLAEGLVDKGPVRPPPPEWFAPPRNQAADSAEMARHGQAVTTDKPVEVLGRTIPEAFLNRALANPRDIAVADDMAGAVTYERMLTGAVCMARRFAKMASPHVGLMLPSSVASDIAFMALQLAGKLPVMLNWTTGPANLAHAARVMGLTEVITSRRFIDRSGVVVAGVRYVYLEDVRADIGRFEALRTLLSVRYRPGAIRAWLSSGGTPSGDAPTGEHHQPAEPMPAEQKPAVVLFTSGSEKAPKAVPLTHENILADQRLAAPVLGFRREDVFLGFLPAFHSFGLNATGLLPLLAGIRVVRHPDPTDAAALVAKIAAYKVTILCGTPTFASYILDRAKPGELDSLRMIITGAEKCPPAVFDKARTIAPHATVLEGYGITECAPVVSVNTLVANKPGTIGRPIPGVAVRIVDVDTHQPLPAGERGMLWVSGPTIFPGYIAHDGPAPFRECDGHRWYVTGDLGHIDQDGYIHFAGRLKRFLKAGGEMISLPALEEPFTRAYPPTKDGPRVAIEGIELDAGGRRIVLFTTEDISLKAANELLLAEGFRGVMRLDEVRRIPALPVLGTGKTDYKVLRAMVVAAPSDSVATAAPANSAHNHPTEVGIPHTQATVAAG